MINSFTSYSIALSGIFTAPFSGIFNPFVTVGLVVNSVLEPAVIIGMAVYAIVAWGLVSLISIRAKSE